MHPSLKAFNRQAIDFINGEFDILQLASDCLFTEGPVWNKEGYYLFSDIPANVIYKITERSSKEIYIKDSGTDDPMHPDLKHDQAGSNALAYDHKGNLLVCQHGNHAIALCKEGKLTSFITSYNDKPLNSPNDLILHSNGKLYFSDPPYGLKDGQLNPKLYQPLAGVYSYEGGNLKLVCDRFKYPNGVCLSPDESLLYICSNKPFEPYIAVYNTHDDSFKEIVANENSDGIETDTRGNIYLCNKDGLIILNAAGERLALIELPTVPANLCWGGQDGKDLMVTARENVFLLKGFLK